MFYETALCPHCKKYWVLNRPSKSPFNRIGPPLIKCSGCGGVSRTKYVLYEEASLFRKAWTRGKYFLEILFFSFLACIFWFGKGASSFEINFPALVATAVSWIFIGLQIRWLKRCDRVMAESDEYLKGKMDENSAVSRVLVSRLAGQTERHMKTSTISAR